MVDIALAYRKDWPRHSLYVLLRYFDSDTFVVELVGVAVVV